MKGKEVVLGLFFRVEVAGDGDVDYTARGDVGWEEDGGEFNLWGLVSSTF